MLACLSGGVRLSDQRLAMHRGQVADSMCGSVFLFVGLAAYVSLTASGHVAHSSTIEMMIVEIERVPLHLTHPDELSIRWVGQEEVLRQLLAAWLVVNKDDVPMNPRLVGKPGVGKTTLAYAAA